jgi:hypothetical protein
MFALRIQVAFIVLFAMVLLVQSVPYSTTLTDKECRARTYSPWRVNIECDEYPCLFLVFCSKDIKRIVKAFIVCPGNLRAQVNDCYRRDVQSGWINHRNRGEYRCAWHLYKFSIATVGRFCCHLTAVVSFNGNKMKYPRSSIIEFVYDIYSTAMIPDRIFLCNSSSMVDLMLWRAGSMIVRLSCISAIFSSKRERGCHTDGRMPISSAIIRTQWYSSLKRYVS